MVPRSSRKANRISVAIALVVVACFLDGCEEEEGQTVHRGSQPGAPWSEEEIEAIRQTIWRLYDQKRPDWERTSSKLLGEAGEEYPCMLERLEPSVWESCDSENVTSTARRVLLKSEGNAYEKLMTDGAIPTVAKFLRLGFHDCFRYEDGTGGCDGCLNFDKLFVVKNIDEPGETKRKADFHYDFLNSSNTNLAMTADVLEEIYTNVGFGYQNNVLSQSLYATGKSRADLWAFAAQVAVEWFMDQNNRACEDPQVKHLYKEPTLGLPFDCSIQPSRYMRFYTGRRDCAEAHKPTSGERWRPYQANKGEVTPNPHATGLETVEYMRREFGMTPRETVAVMGAHAVGTFHSTNAGFRYTWMGTELGQAKMLNNLYFRVLAYKPIYLQSDLEILQERRAQGQTVPGPSNITQNMNPRNLCPGFGPVQWFMQTIAEQGSGLANGGTHVTMLNSDIGFYLSFSMAAGGSPISDGPGHCSALKEVPNANQKPMSHDQAKADCLQTSAAGGDTPLYQIVEQYAENQNRWWDDFVAAMEKLLANGYGGTSSLHDNGVVRTTTTTTPRPPAPSIEECTKDHCCQGIQKNGVCCAWECGGCGGSGCRDFPGGKEKCCKNPIEHAGRYCADKSDVACLIP